MPHWLNWRCAVMSADARGLGWSQVQPLYLAVMDRGYAINPSECLCCGQCPDHVLM